MANSLVSVTEFCFLIYLMACATQVAMARQSRLEVGIHDGLHTQPALSHLRKSLQTKSLLSKAYRNSHLSETKAGARGPYGAGHFEAFAEAESKFDMDGNDGPVLDYGEPHIGFLDGWNPEHFDDPMVSYDGSNDGAVFDETDSANYVQAWQTHYPALRNGIAGNDIDVEPWHTTGWGSWVQDYRPADLLQNRERKDGRPSATWFEVSMDQYDGYGRQRQPNPGSPRSLITWMERSVNTTLTCADRGCSARTSLVAYDPKTEEARNCRLSIPVHPTDFDDEYAGERLEYINVNDHQVNTDCFPNAYACNVANHPPMPMFSCLSEYPVDQLINHSTGSMVIAAKISGVVDECPYEGNLLSAVPMVTCMIRPLVTTSPPPPPVLPVIPVCPVVNVTKVEPLLCAHRGCMAHTRVAINETALKILDCNLKVTIRQTDFDMLHDDWEVVEFVNVSNISLGTNYKPGKNPCNCGSPKPPEGEDSFVVVSDYNVTAEALDGIVDVSAKISPLVDECAADGYLLNGRAEVSCLVTCL